MKLNVNLYKLYISLAFVSNFVHALRLYMRDEAGNFVEIPSSSTITIPPSREQQPNRSSRDAVSLDILTRYTTITYNRAASDNPTMYHLPSTRSLRIIGTNLQITQQTLVNLVTESSHSDTPSCTIRKKHIVSARCIQLYPGSMFGGLCYYEPLRTAKFLNGRDSAACLT